MKHSFMGSMARVLLFLLLFTIPVSGMAEVFRCDEPKGMAMWSMEGHKVTPDGFSGVQPVVIIDEKEMTVVWGDSKSAEGSEKVWKAVIFHRSPESVSAATVDSGEAGSATMLYTIDLERGYLYLSLHNDGLPSHVALTSPTKTQKEFLPAACISSKKHADWRKLKQSVNFPGLRSSGVSSSYDTYQRAQWRDRTSEIWHSTFF